MTTRLIVSLLAAAVALAAPAAGQTDEAKYKLKPGAKGKSCLNCHVQFQETMKQAFVHTPVKNGECSDCHSPHASSHGMLLAEDPDRICATCHADMVPAGAKSAHPDAAKGQCTKCHDPHASANKAQLVAGGSALCFQCHGDLGKAVAAATHKHAPVGQSCLGCHDPHASKDAERLLTKSAPALCVGCHKTDVPAFRTAHLNYPVAKSDCASCHDPHGSGQKGILWTSVHQPVANRMCASCHFDAASPDALKVKKQGLDGCRGCHSEMMNETLALNRVHWPVLDERGCLNCHRPHASKAGKLLAAPEIKVCGSCHSEVARQAIESVAKHAPVADGNCSACHSPHGSNTVLLFNAADSTAVCSSCHDWSKHSSHPIGPEVVDPRNKNARVDCLSCHDSHGSPYKYITWQDKKMDLCVGCHQDFRR